MTTAGGVKQASATEETSTKPEPGADKKPENGPSLGNPTGSAASPPTLTDPKPPGGQAEPSDAPVLGQPRPKDAKSDSAKPGGAKPSDPGKDAANGLDNAAGPQLLAPDAGQEPSAASGNSPTAAGGPPAKTTDPKTTADSSPPAANDAKNGPRVGQSGKAGVDAGPFPALDEQPTPSAGAPFATSRAKSPPALPPLPGHPDRSPSTRLKRCRWPNRSIKTARIAARQEARAVDRSSAPLAQNGRLDPREWTYQRSGGALQRIPRITGEPRPDPAPDFQGDGTVSEQAPLGPQRPQLSIEKVAPPNALLGQPLVYSILVRNIGASERMMLS